MEGKATNTRVMLPSLYEPNPPPVHLGILLIIGGVTSIGLCAYTTIAKIVYLAAYHVDDVMGSNDMMRSDWYYTLLFSLTLPVTMVAVYLHWLSMKLFKHA